MRRPRPSELVISTGLGVLALSGFIWLAPWYDAARWQASPEAVRAARNAEAPTPVWLAPTPAIDIRATATDIPVPVAARAMSTPAVNQAAFAFSQSVALDARIDEPPVPTPVTSESDLLLASADFAFDDPPQPGAHAHLTITVDNSTDVASAPVTLALPLTWLAGYRLSGASPEMLDGVQSDGQLRLAFSGPPAQSSLQITLSFITTDEVIDAPTLSVLDVAGRLVGQAHPPTQAPPPRPGPIYSIDIPRLRLHTGVVPVDWEPPLFVIGQVRASAYVTQGNSVLVGHLRGAAGYNIFDHLDQLAMGDAVIASSRGQTYQFVVTQTEVLPEDDSSPTAASRTPRLTLMTCAGDWNPITRDYADRLWVIAEPMDVAKDTLARSNARAR